MVASQHHPVRCLLPAGEGYGQLSDNRLWRMCAQDGAGVCGFPNKTVSDFPAGIVKRSSATLTLRADFPLPSTAVKLPAPTHLMLGLHATLTSTAEGVTTLFAAT